MHIIFITIFFLIVKIFQLINSFLLTNFFSANENSTIIINIFIFISTIFVFGLLIKKFLPKLINGAWIIIVFTLIITSLINSLWATVFITGLFLYALIGAEAQLLQLLFNYKNNLRFTFFLLSLLPLIISYQISQLNMITTQLFYIISSVLAFLYSYSTRIYGEKESIVREKAPPIWLGLLFITASGLFYYFKSYIITETTPNIIFVFILAFYIIGALIIYTSINEYLQKKIKI